MSEIKVCDPCSNSHTNSSLITEMLVMDFTSPLRRDVILERLTIGLSEQFPKRELSDFTLHVSDVVDDQNQRRWAVTAVAVQNLKEGVARR